MPTFVPLPDGTLVPLPDSPAPELSLIDKGKLLAQTAMEKIGRPLARGFLNLGQTADEALSGPAGGVGGTGVPISPLSALYTLGKAKLGVGPANAEATLPTPQNETKGETYSRRMLEGAPTALLAPATPLKNSIIPLTGALKSLIPAMAGPAAGQAARDYTKEIAPKYAGIADALANTLTQMGTSLGLAHKPLPTPEEAASDTGKLTQMGLNRITPNQKSGLEVANQTSNAANAAEKGVEKQASDAFGTMVQGAKITPKESVAIYQYLRNEASRIEQSGVGQQGEADALRLMADKFTAKNGLFRTDVPSLSLEIKTHKLDPNQTGISENNLKAAIATAEQALGGFSPEFASANKVFAYVKQNMERPLKEGVIGRLSDTNPYPADPTAPGRLNALVKDTSPKDIVSAMASLKAQGASPEDIARAIVAKRVEGGGMSPGARVFGGPGSQQEENLNTLLNIARPAKQTALESTLELGPRVSGAEQVRAPLNAADEIAKSLASKTSLTEYGSVPLHPGAGGIRFRAVGSLKNFFTGNPGRDAVYNLLKNATPAEFKQIQELASFDPKIRLALTLAAGARVKVDTEGN